MGVEKQIASLEKFFRHVAFPLQPLHPETKLVLDTFFGRGGFLNLCDMMFGNYGRKHRGTRGNEASWMDIGNSQPNGNVASAIFRLLAPGGHFCSLLEALSLPPKDFAARLRQSWKGENSVGTEFNSQFCYFDMPLSALYASFHELLAEPADANWYTLSRSRCHPLLLIPFWNPPLITRFEADHGQVLTSLPCSPLAYFIFRMLLYVVHRAGECGAGMVHFPRLDTLGKKIWAYFDALKDYMRGSSSSADLPLYHRLLTAYIQYFVSGAFVEHLSSKGSLEDVHWSTSDVSAALLLSAPSFIFMRYVRQPELEIHRTPCRDAVSAALVFRLIPFLTECFLALRRRVDENKYVSGSKPPLAIRKDFFLDSVALSAWDTLHPDISFYRNALIALRQSLISLSNFRDCRREHFNNSLELWFTMIKPAGKMEEALETYVTHHYEVYSFLLIDVFSMVLRSNFLTSIDATGATTFARCLEVFSLPPLQNVFREVSNADMVSRSHVVDTIFHYFTLNWMNRDDTVRVPKLFGEETLELTAEVYLAVESRLGKGDLDPTISGLLQLSLDSLIRSFCGLSSAVEKHRRARSPSCGSSGHPRVSSVLAEEKASLNTEEGKELFLKGLRRSCGFSGPLNLRFPTENNSVPGCHHPVIQSSFSNEFPALLSLTRLMDVLLEKALEWYYSSWIPRCSRGHKMLLLSLNEYVCINHPQQTAIWECPYCEEVYGSCCRFYPYGRDGEKLLRVVGPKSLPISYCSECFSFFQSNEVVYSSSSSKDVFCSDCASLPFKRISCRFLAAHVTWAIIICGTLLLMTIYSALKQG